MTHFQLLADLCQKLKEKGSIFISIEEAYYDVLVIAKKKFITRGQRVNTIIYKFYKYNKQLKLKRMDAVIKNLTPLIESYDLRHHMISYFLLTISHRTYGNLVEPVMLA